MPFSPAKLKQARTAAKLSQGRLAHHLSMVIEGGFITGESISRWERGRNPPDANMLELLARTLDRPIDYFFERAIDRKRQSTGRAKVAQS